MLSSTATPRLARARYKPPPDSVPAFFALALFAQTTLLVPRSSAQRTNGAAGRRHRSLPECAHLSRASQPVAFTGIQMLSRGCSRSLFAGPGSTRWSLPH